MLWSPKFYADNQFTTSWMMGVEPDWQDKKLRVKYVNLSTKTSVVGTTADILQVLNYSLSKMRFFDKDKDNGQYLLGIKNIQFLLIS